MQNPQSSVAGGIMNLGQMLMDQHQRVQAMRVEAAYNQRGVTAVRRLVAEIEASRRREADLRRQLADMRVRTGKAEMELLRRGKRA
jgi:hypothetical protein